jgi:tRNA dimethylallyltransferase
MGQHDKIKLVIILGPTGSGKTSLALRLAEQFNGEIVNADSMQVYQGMDIGTAKPLPDQCHRIRHHLLDVVPPEVNFSAADFRRGAVAAINDIHNRGKRILVVGGTGLYLRALLEGLVDSPRGDEATRQALESLALQQGNAELLRQLAQVDPETAGRLHPNDKVRIIRALEVYRQTGRPISAFREDHGFSGNYYDTLKLGIRVERRELYRRIETRVDAMLEQGMVDEVRRLVAAGYDRDFKSMRAIGYKELCAYLAGECTLEEAVNLIKRDTRRYAKRQMTWFSKDSAINWLEYPESFATICNHVIDFYG